MLMDVRRRMESTLSSGRFEVVDVCQRTDPER